MANPALNRYNFKGISILTCKSRKKIFEDWYSSLMNVCLQIFDYEGLPETIPKDDLEFYLLSNGNVTLAKANDGKWYAIIGELGGKLQAYYLPTLSVVANPALEFDEELKIGENCVVLLNDKLYQGLSVKIQKYAGILTNIELSMYWATIDARKQNIFGTSNNDIAKDIKKIYQELEEGFEMRAVTDKPLFDLLKTYKLSEATSTVSTIKSLIELRQYAISCFYIDIGLNANYNMKRESLNENEINADNDILIPFIDNMNECRQKGFEEFNKMSGYNVKVKLSSRWKDVKEMLKARLEEQKAEANLVKEEASNKDPEPNKEGDPNDNKVE